VSKFGFVYIWFDRKHHRFYIGSHWGTLDDGYICSSRWMRKAYRRRKGDFNRRIIAKVFSSRADLLIEEQRWLDMIQDHELRVKYYNLQKHAGYRWHTDETRHLSMIEKIKASLNTPEVKEKKSRAAKAAWNDERRQYQSDLFKGREVSQEHRDKISKTLTGRPCPHNERPWTEEYRAQYYESGKPARDAERLKKLNKKKRDCEHCGKSVRLSEYTTFHGERCLTNPNNTEDTRILTINKIKAEDRYQFSGYYITPWGRFASSTEAASNTPYFYKSIRKWCKSRNGETFKHKRSHIPQEWIGRTPAEIGFSFEPVQVTPK
jgi:hypothetical protein